MAAFDSFLDSFNNIKSEGQGITIALTRNPINGTALVSWNIPAPAAGCGTGGGAYDGIVITVDDHPANYLSTSPIDGTFYNGDPTVDKDLNAGDRLDTALVLAAFYNDKKTNSLTITDLKPRTAYYISAYAVDNVGRYHREGVHAYTLPTGPQELTKSTPDVTAYQDILIDVLGGINLNRPTGLDSTLSYDFSMNINDNEYKITIAGVDALTYSDLIDAINKEFSLLENPIMLPHYPNLGGYYWDAANKKLYLWDGIKNLTQDVIISTLDPSSPITGSYWLNGTVLKHYESSGWVNKSYLKYSSDPTQLPYGQLWYDGTDVWSWDVNHWCKLCLYKQTRNPALAPVFGGSTYWFDTVNKLLFKFNTKIKKWDEVLAILSPLNPNNLSTGNFWYNETDAHVYQYVGGTWNIKEGIRYSEPNASGGLDFPAPDSYWFIPSETKLFKRDSSNTTWIEQILTIYPTDPTIRKSCDLWWNDIASDPSLALTAWDDINNRWVVVSKFYHSVTDPSLPPILPDCAIWLNPNTGIMKLIRGVTCGDTTYINFPYDPTVPYIYQYWFNTTDNKFYIWDGDDWDAILTINSTLDPFVVLTGELWFNLNDNILRRWNGSSWTIVTYSTHPLNPVLGTLWYDTLNDILYHWNGIAWVNGDAIAGLKFVKSPLLNPNSRDLLDFYTTKKGCRAKIELLLDKDELFSKLKDSLIYLDPVEGASGLDAGPMYKQLGVGDDGSPDERRKLHDSVRLNLGYTVVGVELTKDQIDECINNALLMIRKNSNISYKRGMFFLDLKPNQQTYILTNKCAGFNKITHIQSIYRMGGAFFNSNLSNGGDAAFGIAALQQLYTVGSFDMVSFHIVATYMKELETLFARRIMFQWVEGVRELRMYQNFGARERVLIDATIERTEQDLLTDRESALWIKNWAIANAKMILSQSRGKFTSSLPGPNGNMSLNAQDLITQATQEMQDLREQLQDNLMQDVVDIGMKSAFVFG